LAAPLPRYDGIVDFAVNLLACPNVIGIVRVNRLEIPASAW